MFCGSGQMNGHIVAPIVRLHKITGYRALFRVNEAEDCAFKIVIVEEIAEQNLNLDVCR